MKGTAPLLALSLCFAIGCTRGRVDTIDIATTTSVVGSGLIDRLTPLYRDEAHVTIRALSVGSGRALKMLDQRQVDAAITHAPAQETEMLRVHPGWSYRKILYNRFLIVGPTDDPAAAATAPAAVEAMRRIAVAGVRFVSRGDESGTHERERQLWSAAKAAPKSGNLVIAGAGMSETLRIASETRSYTLTDENTMHRLERQLQLRIVSAGDPVLLNTYAVVADRGDARGHAFAEWFAAAGARHLARLIAGGDLPWFLVWPADRRGASPSDLPF
jgi:tungstate transport system substrate-binding protein